MKELSLLATLLFLAPYLSASEWVTALIETEYAKDGLGGLSVGIVQGNKLVYKAAFGYADMEEKKGVVVLRNVTGGKLDVTELTTKILEMP